VTGRILFKNQHYAACAMSDGSLVVTRNRKRGPLKQSGVRLVGAQASEWVEHFTAEVDDPAICAALCRAILNP
jgi:hypothetical protein